MVLTSLWHVGDGGFLCLSNPCLAPLIYGQQESGVSDPALTVLKAHHLLSTAEVPKLQDLMLMI